MTRTESINHAFDLLRKQCDPRGHDLLQALENLLVVENMALDAVIEALGEPKSNVVSLIDRYSVKT